ncbi:hypothetical protein YSA_08880 [Pseudomonas putida ND6]|uniref:Uncharacterized protein n=1 Tax=Pseudomonas putida ND6 TaxID=231023 RepID=I3V1E9_PSEPU|nr:hypothetical protein YSA_08880 [Pseudomonas putida ND6]
MCLASIPVDPSLGNSARIDEPKLHDQNRPAVDGLLQVMQSFWPGSISPQQDFGMSICQ